MRDLRTRIGGYDFQAIPVRAEMGEHRFLRSQKEFRTWEINRAYTWKIVPSGQRLSRRRSQLVEAHRRLVNFVVSKFVFRMARKADYRAVYDAAVNGLIWAAIMYDPRRRVNGNRIKFSSFAVICIRQLAVAAAVEAKRKHGLSLFISECINREAIVDPRSVEEHDPGLGSVIDNMRRIVGIVRRQGSERNYEMAMKYFSGQTLESVGNEYGITKERVRQIATKIRKQCRRIYYGR